MDSTNVKLSGCRPSGWNYSIFPRKNKAFGKYQLSRLVLKVIFGTYTFWLKDTTQTCRESLLVQTKWGCWKRLLWWTDTQNCCCGGFVPVHWRCGQRPLRGARKLRFDGCSFTLRWECTNINQIMKPFTSTHRAWCYNPFRMIISFDKLNRDIWLPPLSTGYTYVRAQTDNRRPGLSRTKKHLQTEMLEVVRADGSFLLWLCHTSSCDDKLQAVSQCRCFLLNISSTTGSCVFPLSLPCGSRQWRTEGSEVTGWIKRSIIGLLNVLVFVLTL